MKTGIKTLAVLALATMALMTILAGAASAHHPQIISAECVELDDGVGIRGTSASWLQDPARDGESGNPDIRIWFDGVEVAAGAFTAANGYEFGFGPIPVAGPGPIIVSAYAAASFNNGQSQGALRSVEVSLEECEPPTTTTTTSTTAPPSTTTTTTSTTAPPETTTTSTTSTTTTEPPPTTTSTQPPTAIPTIEVDIACDPERDPYEPLYTFWSGDYRVGATEPVVVFAIQIDDEPVGAIELATLPTLGFHDNWFTEITEPLDGHVRVTTLFDNVIVDVYEKDCSRPAVTTTITEPPATTTTVPPIPTGVPAGNGGFAAGAVDPTWPIVLIIVAVAGLVAGGLLMLGAWNEDEHERS